MGWRGGYSKCKKKKYGDFERNEGLRKNATDIKQKRVILTNEPAWGQPISLLRNGGSNRRRVWNNAEIRAAAAAAATAKSLQLCRTLCDPRDGSPPGSPVPGILQARTLEWVAISFSNAWKWKVKVKSLSRVRLFATPWTAAYQAPPSMGFSRQEYWSGVPLPSPKPGLNWIKQLVITSF